MRAQSQLAYILHKRPFRDSSQILEVFSRDHGRIALLSKGSRNPKSRVNGLLQLYRPLLISWFGRGELPVLGAVDAAEIRAPRLYGRSLMSALYVNELLMYLLHKHDVQQHIFQIYHDCLYQLAEKNVEQSLRLFEKNLLAELGFALNLRHDADSGEAVQPGSNYSFYIEHGPVKTAASASTSPQLVLSGSSLLAYADENLNTVESLKEIKQLNRVVLNHHLGHRKLKSRELFRRPALR
jgi:DNA repair protein RecO (recombination protein O)